MKFKELGIAGVWLIEPELYSDERGVFRRHFCREEFAAHGIATQVAQGNVSENPHLHTLRGFHYQLAPHAEGKTLEIHGDGSQRRDFIHVRDIVAANLAALTSDVHGEIFNVGSGSNISVKELADMISSDQIHLEGRKGDSAATLADISKIKAALCWSPQVSFADGLRELRTK